MRVPDPHGPYKKHPTEPRLMVAREPGEFGGEYYRLMPEGTLTHWDGLTVTVNRDAEGLDLNRNFPTNWRGEHEQLGAGPYPTSEPEVRAMVDLPAPDRPVSHSTAGCWPFNAARDFLFTSSACQ